MKIQPIRNDTNYEEALREIDSLWSDEPNTPDGDRLEVLSILVEHYEDETYPIDRPEPVEAIRYRMEQMDLSRSDVEHLFGGRSKVSEVFSGKRRLSLSMIRRLHSELGIPLEVLIQESPSEHRRAS